jgi:hypothetical protein
VRVTDISETSIQAPLSEGFWCAGNFSVQALSGAAKIEVSRGRFYPLFIKGVQIKPNGATPFEAAMSRPAALNFSAQGWHLADLDMGLRVRPGERAVWLGRPPGLQDLVLAAQAEGVRILGVPLPWGERSSIEEVEEVAAASREVLLLPVFPGPRHPLYGCGLGLAMSSWDGLPREIGAPEVPLREGFEEIRARGGLGVFTGLNGGQKADIRQDILPLFPQLAKSDFYPPGSVCMQPPNSPSTSSPGPRSTCWRLTVRLPASNSGSTCSTRDTTSASLAPAGGAWRAAVSPTGRRS